MSDAKEGVKTEFKVLLARQEEANDRYGDLIPKSDDLTSVVLKSHLIIEEILYGLLQEKCQQPQHLEKARLSFHQMANVLRSMEHLPLLDLVWDAVMKFNALRNKLAHNLEPENIDRYVAEFEALTALPEREELPEGVELPDTPAAIVRGAAFYILGQLSVIATVTKFLESRVKLDMGEPVKK